MPYSLTRLRAVAVDGKTLRGSKNNETGEFKGLLVRMDLAGTVVTFDARHTVKVQAAWPDDRKGAHRVVIVVEGVPENGAGETGASRALGQGLRERAA